ncbi:hypothetical protein [Shewanella japonica]|uniref:hypothetical protein n=1 Tax=Shewanella japonica TaxID=93973 RepID=UPI0024957773|nr:hypothetical protein [Shewanella japonica]
MATNKVKWNGRKRTVKLSIFVVIIIALNVLTYLYKDLMLYGYIFYSSDYKEDNKVVLLSNESGGNQSFELSDYYVIARGEPGVKYFVYTSLSEYEDGIIRIDNLSVDKKELIEKLYSDHYIEDMYVTSHCFVFRFIKPFKDVEHEYLVLLDGVQAVLSFDSNDDEGSSASEICNIFKSADS